MVKVSQFLLAMALIWPSPRRQKMQLVSTQVILGMRL